MLFFHYASHQSTSKTFGISLQNNPNPTSHSFHCCHHRSIHHHLLSSFSIASKVFSMLLPFLCYQKDSQSPPMNFHITQSKKCKFFQKPLRSDMIHACLHLSGLICYHLASLSHPTPAMLPPCSLTHRHSVPLWKAE